MKPFLESNDVLHQPDELRRRADRDGYLFFRGLMKASMIFHVRGEFVRILQKHGWVEPGVYPNDAVTHVKDCRTEGMDEFWPVFDDFQRLESFHALAHEPNVVGMLDRLFGEPTLVHPRNIGRIIFPTTPTTPPHQDYIHIMGTPDTWTAWMPLGNCPRRLGGLAVLAGSHRFGGLPVRHMKGAGGAGIHEEPPGLEWLTSEFAAGDALFFHSHTVHKGLSNDSGSLIRLSVDFRYQGISQPVVEASLLPHFNSDRRVGERMVADEAQWLGAKGKELLEAHDRERPQQRLRTFEEVEVLWETLVRPEIKRFHSMQKCWGEGEKSVPSDSIWFANWDVPDRA